MTSKERYSKWETICEVISTENILWDIYNYLSSDQIEELIEDFDQDYDLFGEDEEE